MVARGIGLCLAMVGAGVGFRRGVGRGGAVTTGTAADGEVDGDDVGGGVDGTTSAGAALRCAPAPQPAVSTSAPAVIAAAIRRMDTSRNRTPRTLSGIVLTRRLQLSVPLALVCVVLSGCNDGAHKTVRFGSTQATLSAVPDTPAPTPTPTPRPTPTTNKT